LTPNSEKEGEGEEKETFKNNYEFFRVTLLGINNFNIILLYMYIYIWVW